MTGVNTPQQPVRKPGSHPFWPGIGLLLLALFGLPASSLAADVKDVTGARIDESVVKQTLKVGRDAEYRSFGEAWKKALVLLKEGVATRIVLSDGVYREGEFLLDAKALGGKSAETLLVIEAEKPGGAVFSGSVVYPGRDWKKRDDAEVYEHVWPHDYGFFPGSWRRNSSKLISEHRRELVFVNGEPLRQFLIESYEYVPVAGDPANSFKSVDFPEGTTTDSYSGVPQDVNKYGRYVYKGLLGVSSMPSGSFAVAERPENGDRMLLRLPSGVALEDATIEVASKTHAFWFQNKGNVVLRGLVIQQYTDKMSPAATVMFGHWDFPQPSLAQQNILIEDCVFRFNGNNQCEIRFASGVTVRRTKFLYGAYGGFLTNVIKNLLMEDVEVSYNNWRIAGGWASAGSKQHDVYLAVLRNFTAIANNGCGLWFDVDCSEVLVDGLVALENTLHGFDWEVSRGVVLRNAVCSGNIGDEVLIGSAAEVTIENSIIGGHSGFAALNFVSNIRPGREDISKSGSAPVTALLGRPGTKPYQLDTLILRNNAIFSQAQIAEGVEGSKLGVQKRGFVPALVWMRDGNAELFEAFTRSGFRARDNVWFSPKELAFGIRKIYGDGWRDRPPENKMLNWGQWVLHSGEQNGLWEDAGFVNSREYDFRLQPGSPLIGRGLPGYAMPKDKVEELRAFRRTNYRNWNFTVDTNDIPLSTTR